MTEHNRRADDRPFGKMLSSLSGLIPVAFFIGTVFAVFGSSIWTKKSDFDLTKTAIDCRLTENEKRVNSVEKNIEGILTSLKYQNEMLKEIKERVK